MLKAHNFIMSVSDFVEKESKKKIPDTRGQMVLSTIISEHFVTGEPVGSKLVAEKFAESLSVSSATVRNVMSELEDLGLLEQPHTSAGRVPTDKGYRFYVDNLLGVLSLSNEDLILINEELSGIGENPGSLMEKTSQLLSVLSKNVGIVVTPSLAHDRLQHIEFVNLSDGRILVILVSAPNIVHNKIIHLKEGFTSDELSRTARYLNVEFAGKSLSEIRAEILKLMHEEKTLFDKLLQTAMILCSQSIESEDATRGEIYVDGTSNILGKSDFADFDRLRELLKTIEEKSRFVQILSECIGGEAALSGDVNIIIGSEHSNQAMQNCAIISAPYRIGDSRTIGSLSVLGPTRIEYARIISVVGYVAKMLEKILAEDVEKQNIKTK